jgi:hypothetical protein
MVINVQRAAYKCTEGSVQMYRGLRTNVQRAAYKCTEGSVQSSRYSCLMLMKLEFSQQIFENFSDKNFMKIRSLEPRVFHADGGTDEQT